MLLAALVLLQYLPTLDLGAVRFSTQIVHLGVPLFQTDFSCFVIYLQFVFHRIRLSDFVTFIQ